MRCARWLRTLVAYHRLGFRWRSAYHFAQHIHRRTP